MRINQNISAMNTYSRLTAANNAKSNSLEKLSSGLRINRAGDDAAGLAISERMRGQIGGLKQATRNAQDGISLVQTAEGALTETHSILNRMRDLAVQASNDTNTTEDREEIQKEINQLSEEVDRIAGNTEFNKQVLMNGKFATKEIDDGNIVDKDEDDIEKLTIHIGANSDQNLEVNIENMDAEHLGIKELNLETQEKADAAIETISDAIDTVSSERSKLGSVQNRLEHTINNLTATAENLSAAESRIRDVDMAEEMMEFTKTNILSQASTAMLAQANQMPQSVLQLLQ